jgi:putative ABC transport system permease protein
MRIAIPLAWHNLTHDPIRFALYILGVGFAVLLMFAQLGFRSALIDSSTQLLEKLDGELFLINRNKTSLIFPDAFSRRRLDQAASIVGVKSAHPVYIEYGLSVLRNVSVDLLTRKPNRSLRVVGIDPDVRPPLLQFPEFDEDPRLLDQLQIIGNTLYDRKSKSDFGELFAGKSIELADRKLNLVGNFEIGTDFGTDGTLVLGSETFAEVLRKNYFLGDPFASVDIGVIRLTDVDQVRVVQERMRANFTENDVLVFTKWELIEHEKDYWLTSTPIGFAFNFGVVIGIAVGTVICSQILSSDVADHMAEYATLRAIGYTNVYLTGVVLQEAFILAVSAFLGGWLASWALYLFLSDLTGMPLIMSWGRMLTVAGLTLSMCFVSGLFALRKVKELDPADVF